MTQTFETDRSTSSEAWIQSACRCTSLLAPKFSIGLFYGAGSEYLDYGMTLRLLSIATALSYLSICLASFLNAVQHSRYSFIAQACCAGAFVVIAMPLTALLGIVGAALGWLIALGIDVMVNTYFVMSVGDEGSVDEESGAARVRSAPA